MAQKNLLNTIKKLLDGKANQAEIVEIKEAISLGKSTIAIGRGSVAIGGNADGAVIVTGDHNTILTPKVCLSLSSFQSGLPSDPFTPPVTS